jgi:hypothetical protein
MATVQVIEKKQCIPKMVPKLKRKMLGLKLRKGRET